MKLGLLADIHEDVEHLHQALKVCAAERVDQVIVLGDVFEMGGRILQTCESLMEANTVGVWGNHDYGLSADISDETRAKYPAAVLDFMGRLRPRLEMEMCHFSHVEPWLDPNNLADLWFYDGPPDNLAKLNRIFHSVTHRMVFVGHYHRWLLATPQEILPWEGDRPVKLGEEQRHFVAVAALCNGHFGIFDTQSNWLVPHQLA